MTREDKLSAALDQAMKILTKVVDSEEYPAAIRHEAQQLLRRWQRGEYLKKTGTQCPSTYTHTTYGKLLCEKDEGHLNRIGDVEHKRNGVKWMSI